MSGEKHVTVSAIKPILKHLEETALAENNKDITLSCDIKRRVIGSQYSDKKLNELFDEASFWTHDLNYTMLLRETKTE